MRHQRSRKSCTRTRKLDWRIEVIKKPRSDTNGFQLSSFVFEIGIEAPDDADRIDGLDVLSSMKNGLFEDDIPSAAAVDMISATELRENRTPNLALLLSAVLRSTATAEDGLLGSIIGFRSPTTHRAPAHFNYAFASCSPLKVAIITPMLLPWEGWDMLPPDLHSRSP